MQELRQDPLTGAWMVLCDERVAFREPGPTLGEGPEGCPWCDGGSAWATPPLGRRGQSAAWPQHAPALRVEHGTERLGPGRWPGLGAHEVVVASAVHGPVHQLSPACSEDALLLASARLADLRRDVRLGTQGWSRRARPGAHGHDTVAAWPARHGGERPVDGVHVIEAVAAAHRDGRELGAVGDVHVWCSHAPQRPFEVRLAWVGRHARGEEPIVELAQALRAVELALEAEVGPYGHDARLRGGAATGAPALLAGVVEVAPVTRWEPASIAGVLPCHGAIPEKVAAALRDRFVRALCHDAPGEVDR